MFCATDICHNIIININTVLHAVVILEMKIISEGTNPEVGRHRGSYLTALSEKSEKNFVYKVLLTSINM